ncbi:MAG: hypothetical protein JO152_14430 [Mycobacteriaceae bacterium]|nr:hypothetical protein [Mycobacteriaceae bacterium]
MASSHVCWSTPAGGPDGGPTGLTPWDRRQSPNAPCVADGDVVDVGRLEVSEQADTRATAASAAIGTYVARPRMGNLLLR